LSSNGTEIAALQTRIQQLLSNNVFVGLTVVDTLAEFFYWKRMLQIGKVVFHLGKGNSEFKRSVRSVRKCRKVAPRARFELATLRLTATGVTC
jgi:hypothetical protein